MLNTTLGEAAPTAYLDLPRLRSAQVALLYERLRQRLRSGQAQYKCPINNK
ncbi:MAG: hypothetical protein V7K49_05995 [Nostoc sp.]